MSVSCVARSAWREPKTPIARIANSSSFLNGKYTVFGQVTSGMEYIDALKKGDSNQNGVVMNPDKIVRMQVAADAEKAGH